jgi:hypothetical protein
MLSFALLELCGPDASAPTARWCVGLFPFRDLLLSRGPLLWRAPVLFVAPPEYTERDASAPTVRSCARDKESLPDASVLFLDHNDKPLGGSQRPVMTRLRDIGHQPDAR